MPQYKLDKVSKLGDMDAKFGQRYWCETSDQVEPLMFNSLDETIKDGDTITAEEVLLKSTKPNPEKGKESQPYHQLKKVKVVKTAQLDGKTYEANGVDPVKLRPSLTTEELLVQKSEQLDRIEAKIDKLIGEPEVTHTMAEKPKDAVHDPIDGEPVSLDDIPF